MGIRLNGPEVWRTGERDLKMQKSVRLKSFELFPQNIDSVEVSLLHALSISVGWPHLLSDLKTLLETGETLPVSDAA